MKPENDSGKWQWIDDEEVGTKTPRCALLKALKKKKKNAS